MPAPCNTNAAIIRQQWRPLFDKCSNVMGVNTLVALNSQGLFFLDPFGEVVRVLREYGIGMPPSAPLA
jgi:hypothetical protein